MSVKSSSAILHNVARQGLITKQFVPTPSAKSSALATYLSSRHTTKVSYSSTRASATLGQGRQNQNSNDSNNSAQQTPLLQLQQPWPNSRILKKLGGGVRFNSSTALQAAVEPKPDGDQPSSATNKKPTAEAANEKTREFNNIILSQKRSYDLRGVVSTFESMKQQGVVPSQHTYNLVLDAYASLRKDGTPLVNLLHVYDEMIQAEVQPNVFTYTILIIALCRRDAEVLKTVSMLKYRSAREGHDIEDLTSLENENNLQVAMSLFSKAVENPRTRYFELEVYNHLLRTLSHYGNTSDGLFVFDHLDRSPNVQPNAATFSALITLYGRAGDMLSSLECFKEFRNLRKQLIEQDITFVYNSLVDAYIKCDDFPAAMDVVSKIMPEDGINPNIYAYNTIVRDLCQRGDTDGAMDILMKLRNDSTLPNPDASTYGAILHMLYQNSELDKATTTYETMITSPTDLSRGYGTIAGYAYLCLAHGKANCVFDIVEDMRSHGLAPDATLMEKFVSVYLEAGDTEHAVDALRVVVGAVAHRSPIREGNSAIDVAAKLVKKCAEARDLKRGLLTVQVMMQHYVRLPADVRGPLLKVYGEARADTGKWEEIKGRLTGRDFVTLFDVAFVADGTPVMFRETVVGLLRDMKELGLKPTGTMYAKVSRRLTKYGDEEGGKTWKEEFESLITTELVETTSSAPKALQMPEVLQTTLGFPKTTPEVPMIMPQSEIASQEMLRAALDGNFAETFNIFNQKILACNLIPTPEVMRDVIAYIGKQGQMELAVLLMERSLELYKHLGSRGREQRARYLALNSVLIAYAQQSDMVKAKHYYQKIKDMGLHPDGNAYASLLLGTARDATDEYHDAMTIYDEARANNVRPTTFFYNVLISRLAKARKLDAALRLFDEMKPANVLPNPITYSAIISACLRAGNVDAATHAFNDMTASPSYQPRVVPFNAMMQFHARQKPDRAKVLTYYDKLRTSGCQPSVHTYRLLMEAHACIEPYDMPTAHALLTEMKQRDDIQPAPCHYATLVHSYGCLQKDVASALAVVKEMKNAGVCADDTVYQALLDIHITDGGLAGLTEAEKVYAQMEKEGVKSTPYIENLFIRGFGDARDIVRAERVFEKMTDEKGEATGKVLREPSTYEAMVKAYLANGQVEKAREIVKRMEGREFPEKVVSSVEELVEGGAGPKATV
ncbi:hypothetical protein BC936DRAFT_139064 [Jimgerdemannia flammicorona]|uniref:PROP1-like PPR domain-containing protein n=1 Tax=Jimgerdemannia flammicorona TaxID=994334 RepID=A0A433DHY7_9FUNG|nr:hypothetical protein BC936DRAFT_139064 [Jimgerdemannia flammicorona]